MVPAFQHNADNGRQTCFKSNVVKFGWQSLVQHDVCFCSGTSLVVTQDQQTKKAAGQACPVCLSAQAPQQIHGELEYYSPNAILQLAALMQLL